MSLASLAAALERDGVAGRIVTPVHDVYRKARRLAEGDPHVTFGLSHLLPASVGEVIAAVERLAGARFPAEGSTARERCWIDPPTIAAQVDAAAGRLRVACERGERVLFGTGHPAGPIDLYASLAAAMASKGAVVVTFAEGEGFALDDYAGARGQIRYVGEVACLSGGGDLLHTHSARPMEYLMDTGPLPDLVVGDHGFAGVALARGSQAVALVDTNDPALALAWAREAAICPIMCDDNRPPSCYRPLADHIIERL